MYKSYHARHYTKQLFRIKAIQPKPGAAGGPSLPDAEKGPPPRYFVNGKWRHRDELLMLTGVDDETAAQIAGRPKLGVH